MKDMLSKSGATSLQVAVVVRAITRRLDSCIMNQLMPVTRSNSAQGDFANTSYLDTLPDDVLHSLSWWYWGKHPHDKLTAEEPLC